MVIVNISRDVSESKLISVSLLEVSLLVRKEYYLRGQSNKFLASTPDGAIMEREIYYRIAYFHRELLAIELLVLF